MAINRRRPPQRGHARCSRRFLRIFPENVASLALRERCGFRVVGTYHRHGKLDGA